MFYKMLCIPGRLNILQNRLTATSLCKGYTFRRPAWMPSQTPSKFQNSVQGRDDLISAVLVTPSKFQNLSSDAIVSLCGRVVRYTCLCVLDAVLHVPYCKKRPGGTKDYDPQVMASLWSASR
jgi:hypothetical protein